MNPDSWLSAFALAAALALTLAGATPLVVRGVAVKVLGTV
ncbi:hypothetical protein GGD56_004355 [Rhizobium mongolense]|uniref:Uncharacterized protein n=1 Tax=Rhizobium mongolense TaxID=57676 RepID=A0ABR6IRH2_9HYPH|nr:hypothetical protein [Rhizobium mongolense]